MCHQTLAGKFLTCPRLCKGNLFGAVYCSGNSKNDKICAGQNNKTYTLVIVKVKWWASVLAETQQKKKYRLHLK